MDLFHKSPKTTFIIEIIASLTFVLTLFSVVPLEQSPYIHYSQCIDDAQLRYFILISSDGNRNYIFYRGRVEIRHGDRLQEKLALRRCVAHVCIDLKLSTNRSYGFDMLKPSTQYCLKIDSQEQYANGFIPCSLQNKTYIPQGEID